MKNVVQKLVQVLFDLQGILCKKGSEKVSVLIWTNTYLIFENIISGIQFNDKKYNKKLKHCWYMTLKNFIFQ